MPDVPEKCPYCKEALPQGATKCWQCGAEVHATAETSHGGVCPYCRKQIDPAALRCRWCRSDLGPEEGCGPDGTAESAGEGAAAAPPPGADLVAMTGAAVPSLQALAAARPPPFRVRCRKWRCQRIWVCDGSFPPRCVPGWLCWCTEVEIGVLG